MTPACLMHGFTCLRTFLAKQDGVQQLWPLRLSPTRPQDDLFHFEELLCDLITIARMISERAGADACLIDPSQLAAKGVLRARRLCCLRRETVFSPKSAAGSSKAGSFIGPFCTLLRGETQIVDGI